MSWSHEWHIALAIYDESDKYQKTFASGDRATLPEALDSLRKYLKDFRVEAEQTMNRKAHELAQLGEAMKELSEWRPE